MSIAAARKELVDRRVELENELKAIDAALDALDRVGAASPRATPRRATRATSRATTSASRNGRKRAPRGQNRDKVLDHLRKSPEDRAKAISAATGISPATINTLLFNLKKEGTIKTQGKKLVVAK